MEGGEILPGARVGGPVRGADKIPSGFYFKMDTVFLVTAEELRMGGEFGALTCHPARTVGSHDTLVCGAP